MFLDNYDEEKVRQVLMEDAREEGWEKGHAEGREAGLEEGRAEGRAEGRLRLLIAQMTGKISAGCPVEQIRKDLGLDIPEIDELYDMIVQAGEHPDEEAILRSYMERRDGKQEDGTDTDL